jgi:hypothetical protein
MRVIGLGFLIAGACACPSKPAPAPSAGSATATPTPTGSATCDSVRPRIDAMYREEAQRKEPKRVDDAVADNVAMVMRECTPNVAACLATAATTSDVEKHCLAPLDPEGTEGDKL